jgi:hypothetical protein
MKFLQSANGSLIQVHYLVLGCNVMKIAFAACISSISERQQEAVRALVKSTAQASGGTCIEWKGRIDRRCRNVGRNGSLGQGKCWRSFSRSVTRRFDRVSVVGVRVTLHRPQCHAAQDATLTGGPSGELGREPWKNNKRKLTLGLVVDRVSCFRSSPQWVSGMIRRQLCLVGVASTGRAYRFRRASGLTRDKASDGSERCGCWEWQELVGLQLLVGTP